MNTAIMLADQFDSTRVTVKAPTPEFNYVTLCHETENGALVSARVLSKEQVRGLASELNRLYVVMP